MTFVHTCTSVSRLLELPVSYFLRHGRLLVQGSLFHDLSVLLLSDLFSIGDLAVALAHAWATPLDMGAPNCRPRPLGGLVHG
jgi:hypothetical protein